MVGMVLHPELASDHFGHARARPPLAAEAKRRRSTAEQSGNLRLLGGREARWATGPRPLFERGRTVAANPREPLADGALAHPERGGDLSLSPAHLEQLPRTLPPAFPPGGGFFCCWPAHATVLPKPVALATYARICNLRIADGFSLLQLVGEIRHRFEHSVKARVC